MSAEALAMRLLAERTRLPVPELIVYDASCRWLPVPYLVMELIPGVPLDTVRRKIAPDARAAIDAQVAAYLRDVAHHRRRGVRDARPSTVGRLAGGLPALVDDILADGQERDVPLPRPYDEVRALIATARPWLEQVTTARLVLWDLWDGNVFVDPATTRVTGIIDVERAL